MYKVLYPKKFYRDYLNHGIRPDGRELRNSRPVVVNGGSISTADGSALVRIGRTTVVCGIKAELCQPKYETPDEGILVPNIELPPLCSAKFKPGPPSDLAQITTCFVTNVLIDSKCIDLKDLCIAKEKLVWCLFIDIVCLDYDGAIIDASLLAISTALKLVKLPSIEYDAAIDNKVVNVDEVRPLKIYNTPVSCTFINFEDKIMKDPTSDEEDICSSMITIAVKDDEICCINKSGTSIISEEKLAECIQDTIEHAKTLRLLIKIACDVND